jgi:hypothetical protein
MKSCTTKINYTYGTLKNTLVWSIGCKFRGGPERTITHCALANPSTAALWPGRRPLSPASSIHEIVDPESPPPPLSPLTNNSLPNPPHEGEFVFCHRQGQPLSPRTLPLPSPLPSNPLYRRAAEGRQCRLFAIFVVIVGSFYPQLKQQELLFVIAVGAPHCRNRQ